MPSLPIPILRPSSRAVSSPMPVTVCTAASCGGAMGARREP
jgi:hypothetical protein